MKLYHPKRIYTAFLVPLFLFSCASYRPILSDNDQYNRVGEAQAEKDIDDCMARADAYLAKHKEERAQKAAGRSAVGGAVLGGVIGALSGNGLQGAVGGAAVGAGASAGGAYVGEKSKDNLKPDELKQAYVSKCLQNKKYEVLGWK